MISDHNALFEACMNPLHVPHVVYHIFRMVFSIILKIYIVLLKKRGSVKKGAVRFASTLYTVANVFKGTVN
jgi:hypothetical protein